MAVTIANSVCVHIFNGLLLLTRNAILALLPSPKGQTVQTPLAGCQKIHGDG